MISPAGTDPGNTQRLIFDDAAARLRALHGEMLDQLIIERLIVGVFFTGVQLSNGFAGVAYTPPEIIRGAGNRILKEQNPLICGMKAAAIAAGHVPGPFAGVIRLATLNALSAPFFRSGHYEIDASGDLSGVPSLFRGRRICLVGAIIPLLKRIKLLAPAEVSIIDRKKETSEEAEAGYGIFINPEHTQEALAKCETAVFTGAAIANGTIGHLLDAVPGRAAIAIAGPSAGFVPEPLFARRVAMVGSVVVDNAGRALDLLAEGGGGYRLFSGCARKINLLNVPLLRKLGLM